MAHAAIERELEIVLQECLPHAGFVRRFGFVQKAHVWAALQKAPEEPLERARAVLSAFNDLRNAITRRESERDVDLVLRRALQETAWSGSSLGADAVQYLAATIFAFIDNAGRLPARS
jgi:hypothetical protein